MRKEKKISLFWTYATVSIFLLIILIGLHSLWQMQRGRQALYTALHDQGEALMESLQSSGKNAILSNKLAQDMLVNRLLDNARLIDLLIEQSGYNGVLLREIVVKNNLFRVQVIDRWGRVVFDSIARPFPNLSSWLPGYQESLCKWIVPIFKGETQIMVEGLHQDHPAPGNLFWVAMARKGGQGAIIIHIDAYYMDRFSKEIGIGKLIHDIAEQKGIRYISFQDQHDCIVAPADTPASQLNQVEYPLEAAQARFVSLPEGEELYEISKPFVFQGRVLGIFRVGLSLDRFLLNMRQTQRHMAWFSLLVILLGSGGLLLIFYRQYIQYKRYKILEQSLHRTERLNSIGKLAAGVAHEIRNPLNAIGMAIQRLQHEYLPGEEENKQEFIHFTDIIREEVKRVDKIVSNFLNLAREPKLERQPMDISSIVHDLLLILSAEAEEHGVKIQAEGISAALDCYCDPNQIKQALMNIIRNAIQAMPDGGTVSIGLHRERSDIVISVRDTGVGITDTARIFEIYYTSKEGGIGLGLPISQKIIEEHGGKIEVSSKVGEGAEFLIRLPMKPLKPFLEMKST